MPESTMIPLTLLARFILIISSLMIFGLSFFHGPDLNLLFFTGVSMFIAAASPFAITKRRHKTWGASASLAAIILYSYLVVEMLFDPGLGNTVDLSYLLLGVPFLCLVFLITYFLKTKTDKGAAAR